MAGPSVMVSVLGDLSKLSNAFKSAEGTGSAAAKGMHTAFSGMLGALNQTGVLGPFGDALDGIDRALSSVEGHAKQMGPALMGVGGALAGIGIGLAALGSKDQAAHTQLQSAIEATGQSYDDYSARVEEAIKHNEKFGDTAAQTQDALRILTQATGDPTKAFDLLSTATDLAAAKHEDLTKAAGQLGKTYNGNARLLKEFGITTETVKQATSGLSSATKAAETADKNLTSAKQKLADLEAVDATKKKLTTAEAQKLRDAQAAVTTATNVAQDAHQRMISAQKTLTNVTTGSDNAITQLGKKLAGQASDQADTFTGKLKAIKATVEDAAASFGQKYGPAITAAGTVMAGMGAATTVATGIMESAKAAALGTRLELAALSVWTEVQTAATYAWAAAEVVAMAAGLPLWATIGLIVLAVAALIAIAYVLYRNWTTIWKAMKDVVLDVWNWIAHNWPLLLAILLGPFTLAAYLIIVNWHNLVAFFAGVGGDIARVTAGMWHGIADAFYAAYLSVLRIWNSVWSWFTGLPGAIAGAASGMFHGFTDAFRMAIDGMIDLWNDFASLTAIHVHIPIPLTKGINFDHGPVIPTIPHLAQGGLITNSGLVYAHAGEVISPTPKGVGGPAVVINGATFHEQVDVDLLLQRTAWMLQRARV